MGLPGRATTLRIFPSRAALEQSLAEAAVASSALLGEGFVTFSGLVDLLAGGARVASGSIMARLLTRVVLANGPARYRQLAADPVAVRAMHGALLELRSCGITSRVVARAGSGKVPAELADLLAVLTAYDDALAAHQLLDDADKWREAVLAVARGDLPPQLEDVREVIVEGDADLFGSRRDLLVAFAARGMRVRVRLPFDPDNRADFAWSEASLALLEARDAPTGAAVEVEHDARECSAAVRVMHVPEPSEEARRIAVTVAGWLHAGMPANAIAVVTPDAQGLGELTLDALRRFGVPAHTRRGMPVARVRRVAAIIAAMGLRIGNFRREELLDVWLALGTPLEGAGGRVSVSRLARDVRASGARSLEVRAYREALQSVARQRFGGDENDTRANEIADALESFIAEWGALPERATLGEHIAALAPMVEAIRARPFADPDDEAGMTAFADVLGDLAATARLLDGEAPTIGYAELHGLLRMLLAERRLPMREGRAGSVAVGTLEDIVGARYRGVVVAGVDGEAFPRRARPDLILTDDMRAALNRRFGTRLLQSAPIDGRAALENDARDRWLWREALAAAGEALVVTYGVREGRESEGRSDVVADLIRARGLMVEHPQPTYAEPALVAASQALEAYAFTCVSTSPGIAPAPVVAADALRSGVDVSRAAWITRRASQETSVIAGNATNAMAADDLRVFDDHVFARVHSVSSLDKLGRCAFLHFGASTLRLREDEMPGLAPEAREDGRAAHEALRYVYRDIMETGGLAAARRNPAAAMQRARAAFDAAHDAILREVPIHPALVAATLAQAWRAVVAQLESDLDATGGLEPLALEYGFDRDTLLRMKAPHGPRELQVRGSIDRVDRGADVLLTLDYKSSVRDFEPGRHFQLAIYGAVVARDFAHNGERLAAAWLTLHDAKLVVDDTIMGGAKTSDVPSFMARLGDTLWARVDRLLAGNITPDPAPASMCGMCDLRALCRARELVVDEDEASV